MRSTRRSPRRPGGIGGATPAGWGSARAPDGLQGAGGLVRLLLAVAGCRRAITGPAHLHEGEKILHVLYGRLRVWLGDRFVDAGQGSVVAVPARVVHPPEAARSTLKAV
jgi:mannose-6-phosphate isomerase-like protein (cupin superfamily)